VIWEEPAPLLSRSPIEPARGRHHPRDREADPVPCAWGRCVRKVRPWHERGLPGLQPRENRSARRDSSDYRVRSAKGTRNLGIERGPRPLMAGVAKRAGCGSRKQIRALCGGCDLRRALIAATLLRRNDMTASLGNRVTGAAWGHRDAGDRGGRRVIAWYGGIELRADGHSPAAEPQRAPSSATIPGEPQGRICNRQRRSNLSRRGAERLYPEGQNRMAVYSDR